MQKCQKIFLLKEHHTDFSLINAYLRKQMYLNIAVFGTIIISEYKPNIRDCLWKS